MSSEGTYFYLVSGLSFFEPPGSAIKMLKLCRNTVLSLYINSVGLNDLVNRAVTGGDRNKVGLYCQGEVCSSLPLNLGTEARQQPERVLSILYRTWVLWGASRRLIS